MPEFKTHSNAGIIAGYIGGMSGIYCLKLSPLSGLILFLSLYAGSIFPDIDSDNSTTFNIIFTLFSLLAAFLSIPLIHGLNNILYFFIPASVFIVIKYLIGFIFKKFSRHRGIYHSIPMGVLISLIIFYLLSSAKNLLQRTVGESLIIAVFFLSGFFIHLILDEINSLFDFKQFKFQLKNSYGTALTFIGNGVFSTIMVYLLIFFLFFLSFENIIKGFKNITNIIH